MPPSFEALLHAPLTLFLPSLLVLAVPPAVAFAYGSLPPAGKHSLASSFAFVAPFCSLDEIYPTSPVKRTRAAGWKILVLVLGAAAMAVRWFGTAGWDLLEHQGTGWVWDGLMGALWVRTVRLRLVVAELPAADTSPLVRLDLPRLLPDRRRPLARHVGHGDGQHALDALLPNPGDLLVRSSPLRVLLSEHRGS